MRQKIEFDEILSHNIFSILVLAKVYPRKIYVNSLKFIQKNLRVQKLAKVSLPILSQIKVIQTFIILQKYSLL